MDKSDISKEQEICLKCRRCCEFVTFSLPTSNLSQHLAEGYIEYYLARGFEVVLIKNFIVVKIKIPCKQLTLKGCKIYDERPVLCRLYDGRQDEFLQCDLEKLNQ